MHGENLILAQTRNLRILRIVTSAECVPWHLNNTLIRIKDDFEVCVAGNGVSAYKSSYPGISWADIPIARKMSPFADLQTLFLLCKLILKYKPHIIHTIMPKAALLGAIAGIVCRVPIRMHTFTGQVWATKSGLGRLFLKLLDKSVVKLNTVCMTDSPSQSNFLFQNNIKQKNQPLPFLGNGSLSGVDLKRFNVSQLSDHIAALKYELDFHAEDFIFVFLGRKHQEKGVIDLIHAFESIAEAYPNIKLLLVGPDESKGSVANLTHLNPRVVNINYVGNPELYLAAGDVFCMPSYREGFGTVVIEANALGLPTIGTKIPGLVDAIEGGVTGILFPPGDVKQLAAAMRTFIEQPELVKKMGSNASERAVVQFSADLLYLALKNFYINHARMLRILT